MNLLETILAQLGKIQAVWMPVLLFAAVVGVLIWRGLAWHYRERLEGFEQRVRLRDDKIAYLEKDRAMPEAPTLTPSEVAGTESKERTSIGLPAKRKDREYVPDEVDPEYLRNHYRQHTTIQADKLAAAYLGKWIRIESKVINVSRMGQNVAVSTRCKDASDYSPEGMSTTWLTLHDNFERAEMLRGGDVVKGEGRIAKINAFDVDLDPAELI